MVIVLVFLELEYRVGFISIYVVLFCKGESSVGEVWRSSRLWRILFVIEIIIFIFGVKEVIMG